MPKLSTSGDPRPALRPTPTLDPTARRSWRAAGSTAGVPAFTAATLTLGYAALGRGSDTLAPVLLVLGYCVLVPLAILTTGRRGRDA